MVRPDTTECGPPRSTRELSDARIPTGCPALAGRGPGAGCSGQRDGTRERDATDILSNPPGTAYVGGGLADAGGSWSATPAPGTAIAVQWLRCDADGQACASIPGATTTNYVMVLADVGHTIRVQETGSNGPDVSAPVVSAPTVVVRTLPVGVNYTSRPVISGRPVIGQTLRVSNGGWTGTPPITFSYQWQRCGGVLNPDGVLHHRLRRHPRSDAEHVHGDHRRRRQADAGVRDGHEQRELLPAPRQRIHAAGARAAEDDQRCARGGARSGSRGQPHDVRGRAARRRRLPDVVQGTQAGPYSTIEWTTQSKHRTVRVAFAHRTFRQRGTYPVKIGLTRKGRALLRGDRRLRMRLVASYEGHEGHPGGRRAANGRFRYVAP